MQDLSGSMQDGKRYNNRKRRRLRGLCCAALVFAAGCKKDLLHWSRAQPIDSHTTSRLNRIQFLDAKTVIIAGGEKFGQSEILISRDGGYTFQNDNFKNGTLGLFGLGANDAGSICLTSYTNQLLTSDDTGKTWQQRQISASQFFLGAAIPARSRPIIISTIVHDSGAIFRLDAGYNIVQRTDFYFGLNEIRFATPRIGYVCGDGVVLKTTDSGDSWQYLSVKGDDFIALHTIGADGAYMAGYGGSIYKTDNGGATWQCLRNGNDLALKRYYLQDILFVNDQEGYAVGENGLIIYTPDGGSHWEEFDRFTSSALLGMAACPNGDVLVCGEGGIIYRLLKQ